METYKTTKHFYYLAIVLKSKFNINKLTGTKLTSLISRLDPFLHWGLVGPDNNTEMNNHFCEWLRSSGKMKDASRKRSEVSSKDKERLESLFKTKLVYGSAMYKKYHKLYNEPYLLSVIRDGMVNATSTEKIGGKFPWKAAARDAYLASKGLTPFKPAAWLKANDVVPAKHRHILTAVDSSVYSHLKKALFLHQEPEIEIDRGNKLDMRSLKKSVNGYCGVYRWIHKKTNETYIGAGKNLSDRPYRHRGQNSSNIRLKTIKNKEGNSRFYLAILRIAGISDRVNSLNVYNVEMDYFLRPVPRHLQINHDTVVRGEYKGKPLDRGWKRRISQSLTGKERSNKVKAAISAGNPNRRAIQLTRYLTDREMCSPGGVKGNVFEVKNYQSKQCRSLRIGYSQKTRHIYNRFKNYPPLIKNKNNGYWYLVTELTFAQKNALKIEPWPENPSKNK